MELKPIFETETIKLSTNNTTIQKLNDKVVVDPNRTIPNGIYKVINWEKIRQHITLGLSVLIMLSSIVWIILYSIILKTKWPSFIIPIIVLLVSFWKTMITIFEKKYLKRSVNRYREDLKIGLSSIPPFISKLYLRLHEKQVSHNWITFTLMFYGGICTISLWWLKDFSWWIFEFNIWIKDLFANPTLMVLIFSASLLGVIITHIVLSIQRKKRILEIDFYFGSQIAPPSEIIAMKNSKNKMYRRLFIISIMIILIIPMVIKIILRIVSGRRKK